MPIKCKVCQIEELQAQLNALPEDNKYARSALHNLIKAQMEYIYRHYNLRRNACTPRHLDIARAIKKTFLQEAKQKLALAETLVNSAEKEYIAAQLKYLYLKHTTNIPEQVAVARDILSHANLVLVQRRRRLREITSVRA